MFDCVAGNGSKRGGAGSRKENPDSSPTGPGCARTGGEDEKSGVTGDCHAPFRGSPGVKFPGATRLLSYQEGLAPSGFYRELAAPCLLTGLGRFSEDFFCGLEPMGALTEVASSIATDVVHAHGTYEYALGALAVPISQSWSPPTMLRSRWHGISGMPTVRCDSLLRGGRVHAYIT
jgi:hypothetical protein